ncbi:hypothetical protein ADH66_12850 [Acutalibacter muris]|uniref:PPM-type phosphatase domain-containing protein n=1 Tax=Acutalibacter muris TaxID=1796620 RepID=A0ABM6L7G4_9FIRM|nr:hypothetical protein A4V00_15490 [Hungateiclostridiaceae bacterium KB18]ASB41460.1 hypothetical protein ADH66_12850 [Acutalibacter muris]
MRAERVGYKINYSCVNHSGNRRKSNQDNFICLNQYNKQGDKGQEFSEPIYGTIGVSQNRLFGVFDGMGGEECGEMAAYIAAKAASMKSLTGVSQSILMDFCANANREICEYAKENSINTMGTTVALLLFSKKRIFLCNLGDSKIFRYSQGSIVQISQDHVYGLSVNGKPPLTQYLGIPPSEMEIHPYLSTGSYHEEDIYLICSDGLTDMVSTERISNILGSRPFPSVAQDLLEEALANGGKDNITIITCKIAREHIKIKNLFIKERK